MRVLAPWVQAERGQQQHENQLKIPHTWRGKNPADLTKFCRSVNHGQTTKSVCVCVCVCTNEFPEKESPECLKLFTYLWWVKWTQCSSVKLSWQCHCFEGIIQSTEDNKRRSSTPTRWNAFLWLNLYLGGSQSQDCCQLLTTILNPCLCEHSKLWKTWDGAH